MKPYSLFAITAASLLPILPNSILAQNKAPVFVYESPRELFGSGDFDGDGRQDIVIVDKETGKYRLGYQTTPGALSWVDNRPSGIKGVTGFTLGGLV
ncbi:MAG TPA: hypothetical protein VEC99_03660, partial [Clostridia bacterium]|nr:hypothetical protein [Clostridia bacterium]